VALVHDTGPNAPGAGLVSLDKLVPFHRSTKGITGTEGPGSRALAEPTATQSVALTHDTLPKSLELLGFGLATIDQLVPSQRSTNVSEDLGPVA